MRVVSLTLLCLYFFSSHAQPPSKFYTTIGGPGEDIGYSGKQTLNNNYIIAGSTSSYGAGNTDMYLVLLDTNGIVIWQRTYGGSASEVGKAVVQLADSGFVVAGYTSSFGAGGYDLFLLRVDKSGELLWQRTFGGQDWDFGNDLVLGPDGYLYVVGYTYSFGNGKKDGVLLKYDLSGTLIFQKFIGGSENEELNSIINTNDNFIACVGYTESKGEKNGDGYFLKLDLNGDTLFTRTFGGGLRDYAKDVVQKKNGNYVIAGAKTYTVFTESLMYTISAIGDSLTERHLLKTNEDECFMSVTNSTTYTFATVFTRSVVFPAFKRQGQIFGMYPSGFEIFINESGGTDEEYEYSIEATKDGGYINVGSTTSFGSIGKDIYFIKRDSAALNYSSIVGVQENNLPTGKWYNRNENRIWTNFPEQSIESLCLYDLTGRVISNGTIIAGHSVVDIPETPKSVYVIKLVLKGGKTFDAKIIPN